MKSGVNCLVYGDPAAGAENEDRAAADDAEQTAGDIQYCAGSSDADIHRSGPE